MATQHAGLPAEVILSINRILEISSTEAEDALDELSDEFNAMTTLNTYFPDGELNFEHRSETIF